VLENQDFTNNLENKVEALSNKCGNKNTISSKDLTTPGAKVIKKTDISSKTKILSDISYRITEPLPPIFNMQLCWRSLPNPLIARFLPSMNNILWFPLDTENSDAICEFPVLQYDNKIKEFYRKTQAKLKHEK
jgi:hypothetical protein